MYFLMVIALLLVLPAASIGIEAARSPLPVACMHLLGKWYVFWAVGVRLFVAGVRQVFQPSFTAREIFEIQEPKAFTVVREIGFANLSFGVLGLISLWRNQFLVSAAIAGGLYYGLAGLGHVTHTRKNANEYIAMLSDLLASAVLLLFVLRP